MNLHYLSEARLDLTACTTDELHELSELFAALSTLTNAAIRGIGSHNVEKFLDAWQAEMNAVTFDIADHVECRRGDETTRSWIIIGHALRTAEGPLYVREAGP
jgi:hypothetical protein